MVVVTRFGFMNGTERGSLDVVDVSAEFLSSGLSSPPAERSELFGVLRPVLGVDVTSFSTSPVLVL